LGHSGANGAVFQHAADPIHDPPHDHRAWLNRNGSTGAVRLQYTQRDIPAYWAYAQQYTLCDNYFTDVTSQSEPNYLMLIAADSPIIDDASSNRTYQPQPPYDVPSLPTALAAAGHDWRDYADQHASYFRHIANLAGHPANLPTDQFDKGRGPRLPAGSVLVVRSRGEERASSLDTRSWASGRARNAVDG
jgi:hypothetical protein